MVQENATHTQCASVLHALQLTTVMVSHSISKFIFYSDNAKTV